MHTPNLENDNRKVLFASVPADGHFNPLTGLASHLKMLGYDVRWYTSAHYAPKLKKLGIVHYPFVKAKEITGDKLDEVFPERKAIKGKVKKLNFDMEHLFIARAPEFYEDIRDIHREFSFDLFVADVAFTAIPFVKDLMNVPVFSIGVMPLMQTSKSLPPSGLGLLPANGFAGKLRDAILRFAARKILFRKADQLFQRVLEDYGVNGANEFIFDIGISKATLYLQSGTPGFEYPRKDLGRNIRFIGSLLPYSSKRPGAQWFDKRLNQYKQVILVTQGTVEKDVTKLLVPAFEAFQNTDKLLVVTTGGAQTEALREAYPGANIIIEDFIPFDDIMPYADVYITNGGYGGVMLGIENRLPMVVAGVHEGKNEICARVGYFGLGINLKTETPSPEQLRKATLQVLSDAAYKMQVEKLSREFRQYDALETFANYVAMATSRNTQRHLQVNAA